MALDIIADVNDPRQNGRLISFDSQGSAIEQEFVRGDINLAISVRPVKAATTGERPWVDDFTVGDTFQVSIGNPDEPPTGGTFSLAALGGTVTSSSVATPSIITHAASVVTIASGNTIYISGHTGAVPGINGAHVITVTDATHFTIPVNVTTGGTGGSFYLASTGLADIAYNVTTAALATALTVTPLTAPIVTLLATGVYEARWGSGVSAPTFVSPRNALAPASSVVITDDSSSDVQVRIIALRQDPVAYAEPATAFTAAGVTSTLKQAGSVTANKVYAISFNAAGTYGGTYALGYTGVGIAATTVGIFSPSSTPQEIQTAFESLAVAGDFSVNQDESGVVTIEMRGGQGLSNTPVVVAANINLLAPLGVRGIIALNTTNLYRAFWNTTDDELTFTLEIRRTRVSGEASAIFQHDVTLKRNLINGVIVPTVLAPYYTQAQTDAAIAAAFGALVIGTIASQDADNVAITGGSISGIPIIAPSVDVGVGTINGFTLQYDGAFGFTLADPNGSLLSIGLASVLLVVNGKTVVFDNSIEFSGTDGSTLDIGAGGTLGSGAFTSVTVGANPTGAVGLTAVNGTALTFLRSDAAPALSQAITPTWTGAHTFSEAVTITPASHNVVISPTGTGTVTMSPSTAGTLNNFSLGQTTPLAATVTTFKCTSIVAAYIERTSTYTITGSDFCVNCTSGTFTVNLPTAVGIVGRQYKVHNSGAGTITLTGAGAELINASNNNTIGAGVDRWIISTGTGWLIL